MLAVCCGLIRTNFKAVTEFTFRFYRNEKPLNTRTFHTETIEEAYKMADNVLSQTPKYDDWECLLPKTNNGVFATNEGQKGTQRSPFGIGS